MRRRSRKAALTAVLVLTAVTPGRAASIAWQQYDSMVPNGGEFACLLARAGTESVGPEKERVHFQLSNACKLPVNFRCNVAVGKYKLPAFDVRLAPQGSTGLEENWVDIRPTENFSVNVVSSPCSIWFGNGPKPAKPTQHVP